MPLPSSSSTLVSLLIALVLWPPATSLASSPPVNSAPDAPPAAFQQAKRLEEAETDLAFLAHIPQTPLPPSIPRAPVQINTHSRLQCAPWDGPALGISIHVATSNASAYVIHATVWGTGYYALIRGDHQISLDNVPGQNGSGRAVFCAGKGTPCREEPLMSRLAFTQLDLRENDILAGTLFYRTTLQEATEMAIPFQGTIGPHSETCG